jgi:hypothetical protein
MMTNREQRRMAIDLSLFMRTSVSSRELLAACQAAAPELVSGPQPASVDEAHISEVRNKILHEAFGFEANAALHFHLNTRGDVGEQLKAVLRVSLHLLEHYAGDAALIYEGDVAYFVRRGTTLTINTQDDLWGPEREAMIRGPFVRAAMPVL